MTLNENEHYLLLMTTTAADGDQYRDPTAFDGLPPLIHPDVQIQRSTFFRKGSLEARAGSPEARVSVPAFEDLDDSFSRYRAPVGPTMRFGS